jgi:hypothetical protein
MKSNATLDQASPAAGSKPVVKAKIEPHAEDAVHQGGATRTSQASLSAALAAASAATHLPAASCLRFPGEDGGRSLAEMAQHDLDAALQLLADRAQYITGAGGAAIALRRRGRSDMLCRASSGSNAPELGALLSTEFGLSGESVRTRQPLRCDNAERDARVNREVCREMGIASVVIMPVVQDDEVLGVFELFSGKVNAFGERDLSALERLSGMVETAVRMAQAAEGLGERLKTAEPAAESAAEEIVEVPEAAVEAVPKMETKAVAQLPAATTPAAAALAQAAAQLDAPVPTKPAPPGRPLLWSAAPKPTSGEVQKAAEPDPSHVPPVLRNLRKCEACGFPVSAGRVLCVECEEKKWRGQLQAPQKAAAQEASSQAAVSGPAVRGFAAVQSAAAAAPALAPLRGSNVDPVALGAEKAVSADVLVHGSDKAAGSPLATALPPELVLNSEVSEVASERAEETAPAAPEVVFSAGLESSQSWFARNRYVLGALLVVAAVVAAIVLLR